MGERVGQFELDDEPLAVGGMGAVFRARDAQGRRVAIKRMHPALQHSAEAVERVRREAAALTQLQGHPNIVRVLALVESPLAIAMEFLEGESFDAILGREPHLPLAWVVAQFRQVAEALAFAHEQGVLHRDLKPANVMLAQEGGHQVVKVLDFGLARLAEGTRGLTRDGQRMGTPEYMAPEQHLGEAADARTDVYALGVLLFAFVTGKPPFEVDSVAYPSEYAVARAHLEEGLPVPSARRPEVPAWIDEVVARATRKRPEERFATARALLAAYGGPPAAAPVVVAAPVVAAPVVPAPMEAVASPVAAEPPTAPQQRPSTAGWWLGGAVVLLGLAAVISGLSGPTPADEPALVVTAPRTTEPKTTEPRTTEPRATTAPVPVAPPTVAPPPTCATPDECVLLAERYSQGDGVPQDRTEAARLRVGACDAGHPRACNDLGYQYEYGRGVSADPQEALRLYERACNLGHALACSNLGAHQMNKNPAAAAPFLQLACDAPCDPATDPECSKGRTAGCRRLGKLYVEGNGVPRDVAKGRALIQWACDRGNSEACKQLLPSAR